MDRVAFGVLQLPIKTRFGLTDSELGALTGFAFFLPYTLLSMPMARLADRTNRKRLLLVSLLAWSAMTMGLGLAASFWALFVLRMGVAIGETTCLPAAYSLIADFFQPRQRARATAVFALGYPIGSFLGLSGAGLIAARWGWQPAVFAIGALGLMLAPLVAAGLREPDRGDRGSPTPDVPPFGQACRLLWSSQTFRYTLLANSFQTFVMVTSLIWTATFYVRVHHLTLAQTAVVSGVLAGVAGGAGTLIGGLLADRLGQRSPAWLMRLPAITTGLTVPATLLQFISPNVALSMAAGLAGVFLSNMHIPTVYATSSSVLPPRVRAFGSGVLVMGSGLLGQVCGSVMTGWISDFLQRTGFSDGEALRLALCAMVVFSLVASWFFILASRHIASAMGSTAGASEARADASAGNGADCVAAT
jgi:MFS family permease